MFFVLESCTAAFLAFSTSSRIHPLGYALGSRRVLNFQWRSPVSRKFGCRYHNYLSVALSHRRGSMFLRTINVFLFCLLVTSFVTLLSARDLMLKATWSMNGQLALPYYCIVGQTVYLHGAVHQATQNSIRRPIIGIGCWTHKSCSASAQKRFWDCWV